jgi:hypothetical protein
MSVIAIDHNLGTLLMILVSEGLKELWKSQKLSRFAEFIQSFLVNASGIEIPNWLGNPDTILRLLCTIQFAAMSPHTIEEKLVIHHSAHPQTVLGLSIPPLPTTMSP